MIAPLFVELCAGLASVSGVLQHGSRWKPPISRMGRKTGYALPILRVMGLRPRQRAARYLWAEADGDVAALLAAYTQPALMREVADIIRSWIPCPYGPHEGWCARCKGTGRWDARDLWEVLRREPRRGLWAGGGDALTLARFALQSSWSYEQGNLRTGFTGPGDRRQEVEALVEGITRAAHDWPPVLIAQDASVAPGEVAGWALSTTWTRGDGRLCVAPGACPDGVNPGVSLEGLLTRWNAHDWPPVAITPDAGISPPEMSPGTVVYMDPPYVNTTGYAADFTREQVCAAAEHWAAAGARVYISEGEPVSELAGWHVVEITSERTGQARTFGATREFLTCSHPPAWRPATQNPIAFEKEQ